MVTPFFVCGAECGLDIQGSVWPLISGHWTNVPSTAGVFTAVTSGPVPMRSDRCFHYNDPSTSSAQVRWIFDTTIASPATVVARFYIYFDALPSADVIIFSAAIGTNLRGLMYVSSDQSIRACGFNTSQVASSGFIISLNRWYRIDMKMLFTGAALSVEWQVDGATQTSFGVPTTASCSQFIIGKSSGTSTLNIYYDDIVLSSTAADYPIGPGKVIGLYPNGDGVHGGSWASGVFGKGVGAAAPAARTDTDIWQSLNKPLPTTIGSTWVADITGILATNYTEFVFDNLPSDVSSVNGVMIVSAVRAASALPGNIRFLIADSTAGAAASIVNSNSVNIASLMYGVFVRNTDRAGVAWTPTTMNDVRVRFTSTDSDPDMYLDGICFEVDTVPLDRTLALTPGTITLSAGTLGISLSGLSLAFAPGILTLTPGLLDIAVFFGGAPNAWTGSAWVPKPARVWDGGTWVAKPMKVWTGSVWDLV